MADIVTDSRPVSELLRALQTEGVREDNHERLRRQLADVHRAIQRLPDADKQYESSRQQVLQVFERLQENLRFAREAQQLLEESIFVARSFISMRLRSIDAEEQAEDETAIKSPRPVEGKVDHVALTREIIARYPKILAALAK